MTFARVQGAAEGVNASSVTVTLGTAPAAGNLLVAWANSDALVSIGGTGWTAGPVVIDGNGAYAWWKLAGASEPSTVVFTPSVSDWIVAGVLEYSGPATAPFDVSGSTMISGSPSTSTTAVAVTTTADHELGVALAHLHTSGVNPDPTAPSWTGGFSTAQGHGMSAGGTTAVYTLAGDNLDLGAAGGISTAASWTGSWPDAQGLLLTFKPATSAHGTAAAASTSSTTAAGTRAAEASAAPASASALTAAGHRTAHAAAPAASASSVDAAGHRLVHGSAALASASGTAAAPDSHSRLTPRPFTGTTLRP